MPNYRRSYVPGGTFFFTVVTHERRPILTTVTGRSCLRIALQRQLERRPFNLFAIVLLPDHLHTIWTLPDGDTDFSTRWQKIKDNFTRRFVAAGGEGGIQSESRTRHGEQAIWQRRFWEHTCKDEDDLKRFLDYLHWNPVKHGLVNRVVDYPWSTFHQFVKIGEYDPGWGGENPWPGFEEPEWE